MRLAEQDRELIVDAVHEQFGEQARVKLFGSRLYDDKVGGDIDLLISLESPASNPTLSLARLNARLHRLLSGRKVDLVLKAPNIPTKPIQQIADEEGEYL